MYVCYNYNEYMCVTITIDGIRQTFILDFLQSKATGLHAPHAHDSPSYPLHKCSHLGVDVEYTFLMANGETIAGIAKAANH